MTSDVRHALATRLETLEFPARMESFFARRGLQTVGDLVALVPRALLLEPNLGRKSIEDARTLLRKKFDTSWEELQQAAGGAPVSVRRDASPAGEWSSFAARLPPARLDSDLRELALPARMATFASRRELRTVRELVSIPYDEIAETRGVGEGSLRACAEVLRDWCEPIAVTVREPESFAPIDPLPPGSHWKALLREAFRELSSTERLVVTQRSGLVGPIMTLADVGETLGVSRERIRQIEGKALERVRARPWLRPAGERFEALVPQSLVVLPETGLDDELFALSPDDVEAFEFFVNDVLDGPVRVLRSDGQRLLSRLSREDAASRIAEVQQAAADLQFPFRVGIEAEILAARTGIPKADIDSIAVLLANDWLIEDGEVRGFGSSRRAAMIAFVRGERRPVTRVELEARFGRGVVPSGLVLIDWGLYALTEQIPDWARWLARIPPLVKRLIEQHGAERQWSTAELLPLIVEEAELPAWMNEWTLGSLLRDVPEVRYLGRNVVALPEVAEERLHIFELAVQILEQARSPIAESAVLSALQQSRGVGESAWMLLRMRRPIVLFTDGRVGLTPRDIAGGEPAIMAFADEMYARLQERNIGFDSSELAAVSQRFGDWDPRVARSLLRHDGRFRCSPRGAVGLAEWGETRAATRADKLEQLLHEYEGAVPVEIALGVLPTISGAPLSRERAGLLANSIGARLVGPFIEWSPEPGSLRRRADPLQAAIAALPESASAEFVRFLAEPKELARLRAQENEWLREMRAEARVNPAVEAAQVERLHLLADEILTTVAGSGDENHRLLASAALEYLVTYDDACADKSLGGLDDDERVLEVVLGRVRKS